MFPIYVETIHILREEGFERKEFTSGFPDVWERLLQDNQEILALIESNNVDKLSGIDFSDLDFDCKSIAIYILPNDDRKWAVDSFGWLVETSVDVVFSYDRNEEVNYQSRNNFLKKYSAYILSAKQTDIPRIIKPCLESFNSSEGSADLLEEMVLVQDRQNSDANFWVVWELLKPRVIDMVQNGRMNHSVQKIVKNYLFALPWWNPDAKDWHAFHDRNSRFFNEMAGELSRSPSTLYSFAMLLNGIGGRYSPQGVAWIAKIIKANGGSLKKGLEVDTIYYMNAYMRRYLYRERKNVRRSPELIANVLVVLDFLIE